MSQPVRVLQLITWMDVGGAQDHLLSLVRGIDHDRFELTVAVGSSGGSRGELRSALGDLVEVVDLRHLVREISPSHDLRALPELGRLFDRLQPDILHTHSSKAGVLGRLAARSRPIRTVHNVHGWSFNGMREPGRSAVIRLERWIGAKTDVLLLVSGADLEVGEKLGIRPRVGVELVRSGIDLSRFQGPDGVPEHESRLGDGLVIGSVGRLAEPKDPITAIRAFAIIASTYPTVRLRWIGDGPLRGEAELESNRLGIAERCDFVGTKFNIPDELRRLDLFILSSRWEGLPRSLIEAAAARVPIVATDVGGVGDFIKSGETGMLVASGQPDALAAAIAELLEDRQMASDLAANAALVAEGEFSSDEMCRRTQSVYDQLAA